MAPIVNGDKITNDIMDWNSEEHSTRIKLNGAIDNVCRIIDHHNGELCIPSTFYYVLTRHKRLQPISLLSKCSLNSVYTTIWDETAMRIT